jgi:Leucine-rich repeat (LRR) protein
MHDSHKNTTNSPKLGRPQTPHLDMIEIRELKKIDSSQITKNFSLLMKQIVDYGNDNFLNGDINLIEYIISKYAGLETEELSTIEKFSIKIISDFGLLNIFGGYLPNLKELKLNESAIPSISDIGSNFTNLRILHINNCGLKDLQGILF